MLLLQCLPLLLEEVVSLQGYPFHHVLKIELYFANIKYFSTQTNILGFGCATYLRITSLL